MINNKIKLALVFFVAFIILISPFAFQGHKEKSAILSVSSVCIKNNCFLVEIADNPSEREIGLMGRKSLDEESGMLFVFEQEGVYKFWMKNTLIPLDMIWIDGGNKIIFIKENAEPCKTNPCEVFGPDEKAKYVLEINGGTTEKMKLKIGDAVEFM